MVVAAAVVGDGKVRERKRPSRNRTYVVRR